MPIYTESNFHYIAFSSKTTVSSRVTRWTQEDKSNNTAHNTDHRPLYSRIGWSPRCPFISPIVDIFSAKSASHRVETSYSGYRQSRTLMVSMYSSGPSWIGLLKYSESSTDPSPSAQYWLDGSTSTYRRWAAGKPSKNNTRCIRISYVSGKFLDRKCGNRNRFVCKKTGGVYVVCTTLCTNIFRD